MDLNITILEIINAIIDYSYYDSLTSREISQRGASTEELNDIRDKSGRHVAKLFPDTKFHNGKGQLLSFKKIQEIVQQKIEDLSEKEIKEYVEVLQKDAKKIARLYKKVSK